MWLSLRWSDDVYCRFADHQIVWRGVREDLSGFYTRGKEFTWWAATSCTSSMSVLESPDYVGKSGPRTLFSIETQNARVIRGHSYFQQEDEIILAPGRYLRVIDQLNPAPDLHIIHLREITPPYPMLSDPFDLSELQKKLPAVTPRSPMPVLISTPPVAPGTSSITSGTYAETKPVAVIPPKKGKLIEPYSTVMTMGGNLSPWTYQIISATRFSSHGRRSGWSCCVTKVWRVFFVELLDIIVIVFSHF